MQKKSENRLVYQADCPSCGEKISWSRKPQLRQKVVCAACQSVLKVSSHSPLNLEEMSWKDDRNGWPRNKIRRQNNRKKYLAHSDEEEWDEDELIHNSHQVQRAHLGKYQVNRAVH